MNKRISKLVVVLLIGCVISISQIPGAVTNAKSTSQDFECDGNVLVRYTGTGSVVSVPGNIKEIGNEAFFGNPYVRRVKLPGALEKIGQASFAYCSRLEKISIPDSVIQVDSGAFACDLSLKYVKFGKDMQELGNGVFAGCTNLENVKFKDNVHFNVSQSAIFDKTGEVLYQYLPGCVNTVYNIPDEVKQVRKYAFWGCDKLKNVSLSSNMSVISGYSFSNCTSLENVHIPYSVNLIDVKAFEDCISLEEVYLPPSISKISDSAFDGCSKLFLKADVGTDAENFALHYNGLKSQVPDSEDDKTALEENNTFETEFPFDQNKVENESQNNNGAGISSDSFSSDYGTTKIVGGKAVIIADQKSFNVLEGRNTGSVSQNETEP